MTNWGEKDLFPAALTVSDRRPQRSKWRVLGLITLLAVPIALHCASPFLQGRGFRRPNDAKICPQADALYPDRHAQLWEILGNDFSQDAFTLRAVEWLGGAVRVP
jgi:Gly-Xaa carboxypeptidase